MAFLKPDKTTTLGNGLVVKEYLLTVHNPNKISLPAKRTATQPLIGVTIHNTSDIKEASGTTDPEQYTRATVNGNMGDSRVHYYVNDIEAWRNFDDSYTSWHSATGGNGQGNCNTISVECIMKSQTDTQSLKAMENAAKLIAWIFGQYGWTVEKNLYTHNYWTNYKATGQCSADLDAQNLKKVSTTVKCFNSSELANKNGKYCPIYLLPQWEKFKALVRKHMGASTTTTTPSPIPKPSQTVNTTPTTHYDATDVTIWEFFTSKGLNAFAAAGLMGNLYAESGLVPSNLQNSYEKKLGYTDATYTAAVDSGKYTNFVRDSAGYGLAQWTYWSRKQALLDFAKASKASIGDLTMQLNFLWKELQGYPIVMTTLKTATSVLVASNIVLTQFERPADMGASVQAKRASYGQGYYDKYAKKPTTSKPTTPTPSTFTPYTVRVTGSPLNVRKGAGTNYAVVDSIKDKGVYTIIEEANGTGAKKWGKLKSNKGWISLDFTQKIGG